MAIDDTELFNDLKNHADLARDAFEDVKAE